MSKSENVGNQNLAMEKFIEKYLNDKYNGEFEIIEIEKNTNITNIGKEKTSTINILCNRINREFLLFVNEEPSFTVADDLYPSLLIEDRLQTEVDKYSDYPGKTFVFLDNLDKESRDNYNPDQELKYVLSQATNSTWKVFILLKPDINNTELYKHDINLLLEDIMKFDAGELNVECVFFNPKSDFPPDSYSVDRSKNFDERFPDNSNIIETWLGSFNKIESDFSSKMRKIKY